MRCGLRGRVRFRNTRARRVGAPATATGSVAAAPAAYAAVSSGRPCARRAPAHGSECRPRPRRPRRWLWRRRRQRRRGALAIFSLHPAALPLVPSTASSSPLPLSGPTLPPPPHPPRRRRTRAHRAARPRVCTAASDDHPASVGRWLPGWWRPCLGGSRRPSRRWRPLLTLRWVRQARGDHLPPLGRIQSAGRRGACWWPLPTSGRVPPRRQRLPLVRAAVDAAAAVSGAPPTPASGGHVGDCHHRHHGRLPRLVFYRSPARTRAPKRRRSGGGARLAPASFVV